MGDSGFAFHLSLLALILVVAGGVAFVASPGLNGKYELTVEC